MKNEIKILLTSDLHLGMNGVEPVVPENIRMNTFKKITALAQEHDILLIAGDLFDSTNVSPELVEQVAGEFKSIRDQGTEIVYCPGNGELDGRGVIADFLYDLHASCLFSNPVSSDPFTVQRGKQTLHIYGIPPSPEFDLTRIKKEADDGFHLGLFYTEFNNNKSRSGFRNLNLDFYALGSNHDFKMFKVFDKIIGAFPGCPEAVTAEETGDRYVISLLLKDNEVFQIKRLTVNSIRLKKVEIDCSSYSSARALRDHLMGHASQKEIATVTLNGARDFSFGNEIDVLRSRFFDLFIIDNSRPTLESLIVSYGTEDSIRGNFYSILQEHMGRQPIRDDLADNLAAALNVLTVDGLSALEDWLCAISDV